MAIPRNAQALPLPGMPKPTRRPNRPPSVEPVVRYKGEQLPLMPEAVEPKPDPREGTRPPREERERGMAAIREEQDRKAAAAPEVTAEAFRAMHRAQLDYVAQRYDRGVERAEALFPDENSPEADWRAHWLRQAALEEMYNLRRALEAVTHPLFCPNGHAESLDVTGLTPDDVEALSYRGLITGEGVMAWSRYCLSCQSTSIRTRAEALHHKHLETVKRVNKEKKQ